MRGTPDDAGTRVRAAGWCQGAVADAATLRKLGNSDFEYGIVISQDCDIAQGVDREPSIEFVLGNFRNSPRPDCQYGRNPRELDISAGAEAITLDIRQRVNAEKQRLVDCCPSAVALPDTTIRLIISWVAKRYTRAAWPDAFNTRLKVIDKKLERLFKRPASKVISGIWLSLTPAEELATEESYRLFAWLTVPSEVVTDKQQFRQAHEFAEELEDLLGSCAGIDVDEIEVRGEADVSLDDLKYIRRFDRDYRSNAPKPGGALPPEGV